MIDPSRIYDALIANGLPVTGVVVLQDGTTVVPSYSRALTGPETTTASGILVNTFYTRRRRPRSLFDIYQDCNALSGANKTAVWADISSGSPAKYKQDRGANAAALLLADFIATTLGVTGTTLTDIRMRIVVAYVQDNPSYLVNPAFAPSVNVPGDEIDPTS